MLPVKKIYINTKKRTLDSESSTKFKIEFSETLTFPSNSIFYVDDVSIPHAWKTVEANVNDKLYVQLTTTETDPQLKPNVCKIVSIEPGNYNIASLATEMKTKLDAAFDSVSHPSPVFTVTPNVNNNTLTITPLYNDLLIKILTPLDLYDGMVNVNINGWFGGFNITYDKNNTQDMNDIISNNNGRSQFFTAASPFVSGFVDLQPIKNLYLSSSNLGTFTTIGVNGERTIIKKIPVSANTNEMIFDNVTSSNDYLDCSRQTLKTVNFELRDGNGNLVNLHGANWSFSLVFDKYMVNETS